MGQTILATLNELIQKLEDLDTQDELTALGDKIDALAGRISPAGQNVQQTLRTGLIGTSGAYLKNLNELDNMRRAISSCCSASLNGDKYDDLPPLEVSRKCKIANLIWDNTYDVFNGLNTDHADMYAIGLTSGGVTMIVGTLAAALVAPAVGIAAAFVALAVSFLVGAGTLSLLDMLNSLTQNKNTIICGLLKSTNTADARDVFQNSMTNVTKVELFFINILMTNDLLNNLFNNNEVPDGYTPGYDCGGCSGSSGDDCPNREPHWSNGTPSLLDASGNPVNGVTRSELTSGVDVCFELGGVHKVTVTSLHIEGAVAGEDFVQVTVLNCGEPEDDESIVCHDGDVQVGDSYIGAQFTFYTPTTNLDWFEIGLEFTPASESNAGCVSGGGQ